MQGIKLVCFDLDDTLWPCMPTIIKAEQALYAWFEQHKPAIAQQYTIEQLREKRLQLIKQQPALQHNLTALRKTSFEQLADEFNDNILWVDQAFDVFYQARQQVNFYTDVAPVLDKLSTTVKLASMTNGNANIMDTELGHYFDYAISAEAVGAAKPDMLIFESLVEKSQLPAEAILFVGDHQEQDILGAEQAGFKNVWLNRHAEKWKIESYQPEITIQNLQQLLAYFDIN